MTSPVTLTRNESRSSSLSSRLFKSKSGEGLVDRKASVSRLHKSRRETPTPQPQPQPLQEEQSTPSPPRLPEYTPAPLAISPRMTSREVMNGTPQAPPVPPIPAHVDHVVDPYARTESMTNRGRYSYAPSTSSTINSPRRVLRRRKDPTPFNILIIGARNSGKTSLINFLKSSLTLPVRKVNRRDMEYETPPPSARPNRHFSQTYQEIEVEGERIGLTLWDSQGLDKGIVDLQLREMGNFVESKFEDTFAEEMKVVRSPGIRDTHIHCVLLILDPAKLESNIQIVKQGNTNAMPNGRISKTPRIIGALDDDFELQVIRSLQGKTTILPVISKADTITVPHMAFLKKKVCESLTRAGLDPLEALSLDEESDDDKLDERDEDEAQPEVETEAELNKDSDAESIPPSPHTEDSDTMPSHTTSNMKRQIAHKRQPSNVSIPPSSMENNYMPFSILSPDEYSLDPNDGPVGRKFAWGFADPYNQEHCDFVKLKNAMLGDWRSELRDVSRERFYETWRTNRLNHQGSRRTPEPSGKHSVVPLHLNQVHGRFSSHDERR